MPSHHPLLPPMGDTHVYHTADGAPYIICRSHQAFVNPTSPASTCPQAKNANLNMNLGQSVLTRQNWVGRIFTAVYRTLDKLLVMWWEPLGMYFYNELVPLKFKRFMTQWGWAFYVKLHTWLLNKNTGLHPSQSVEYHALTTALFQSKFLAWTPRRMRFFLKELRATSACDPPCHSRVEVICDGSMSDTMQVPNEQADHSTVKGWYIRQTTNKNNSNSNNKPNDNTPGSNNNNNNSVIFWIYGGAYLSGDARGNASIADELCAKANCQAAFVPEFRLAPEANLWDVLWDLCLALYWLQEKLKNESDSNQQVPQIYLMGVSSGAALATRLLQLMARSRRNESLDVPAYFQPLVATLDLSQIGGAVLFGPYVDYEQLYEHERHGSFLHYAQHDLIVNEAVQEYGLPYLKDFIPTLEKDHTGNAAADNRAARRKQSPIHQPCRDLPPLCIVTSEHECVHDQTLQLANRARSEGVQVTLGVWKYMCHVFSLLNALVPEGQLSLDFAVAWMHEQQKQQQPQKYDNTNMELRN